MQLSDFDFNLPKELIAQSPPSSRSGARLLVINGPKLESSNFSKIADFFQPGDCLVLNDTKVLKARILIKQNSQQLEIFLHKPLQQNLWQAFAKPAKKFSAGQVFEFANGSLLIKDKLPDGQLIVEAMLAKGYDIASFLEANGNLPLPPYIKRSADAKDDERYQTVFAKNQGSVAAPTAGLHFSKQVLAELQSRGVNICYITLHVGAGTFLPVKCQDISQHRMHSEHYHISKDAAEAINSAKKQGSRIVAVGTTSLRALESAAINGQVVCGSFQTDIFITPGFKFQIANLLITNFHLPKSTLLMLACAFGGYQNVMQAYNFATQNNFSFFSYGDACLIYPTS